jgi:hypothetical protein
MNKNVQEELVPIVIDLNIKETGEINESFLRLFGTWIQKILGRMFGGPVIPVKIRGDAHKVKQFAQTLYGEKKYIEAYNKHGLNDPQTFKSKAQLKNSVSKFERATGIKWPFK